MTEIYVSPTGSDSAAGTAAAPFRTISRADQSLPAGGGNTIVVLPGVHESQAALWTGGASGRPNRLVGRPGATIHTGAGQYDAVRTFSSYWEITGLEIIADSGHGVDTQDAHHVWVHHCHAHDCEGSGFSGYQSDWIIFEDNLSEKNAHSNGNQCSGISFASHRVLASDGWAGFGAGFDAAGLDGFRSVIRRNVSRDNVEGAAITARHTDGNGIIVDWMRNEGKSFAAYPGRILIEGNLVYRNGAKGIQVFKSDYVTVRGNTAWCNNTDAIMPAGDARMELSNQEASDNVWTDNIAVCDSRTFSNAAAIGDHGTRNTGVTWTNNLTFDLRDGGAGLSIWNGNPTPSAASGNLLGVDPRFIDAAGGDFTLQPGSPARGAGTGGRDIGWSGDSAEPEPGEPETPEPPVEPVSPGEYRINSLFANLSPTRRYDGEGPYELGTRFTFARAGKLTGLRLYRLANNGGTTLRVWKGGNVVASAAVASGGSGWVRAAVNVPVAAGDVIIVSWAKANGRDYPAAGHFFDSAVSAGSISADAGLFAETVGALPTQTYQGSFYWTDVVFEQAQ